MHTNCGDVTNPVYTLTVESMASTKDESTSEDFPSELHDRLTAFDESLNDVGKVLEPLHAIPLNQLHEKLSPMEKAKLDLLGVYAINSLFWGYLITKGEDPKQHGIKRELDRIRSYMGRVKEIEDKVNAPKVDTSAAKRFIRSALWQQAQKKSAQADEKNAEQSGSSETQETPQRLDDDDTSEPKAKVPKSSDKKKIKKKR